jgi:segregation and condensation protein A
VTRPVANPRFLLDIFEGPLDLLLHLIKKNEVDIYDIPIATITDQYLAYLEFLDQLNLDLAGEYLVMAATLMHIKSRMLLPASEGDEEDEEDPRDELVQQLEEYRRFREAAGHLAERDILFRDVFPRAPDVDARDPSELPPLREMTIGDLVEALKEVLKRLPEDQAHSIVNERISIADRIPGILERLRQGDVDFHTLFPPEAPKREVIATFLALLELVRLKTVRAFQSERFGAIRLTLAVPPEAAVAGIVDDSYED